MIRSTIGLMLILVFSVSAETVRWADLQKNIDSWIEGPPSLLVTSQERDVYGKLKTPEEKMQFIKIFWQRRDPILRTRENEFKDEFYRRVEYANANFAEGNNPGWMTARGQMYLLFGPPSRIDTQSVPDSSRPAQLWVYDKTPSKELPPNEAMMFVFRDFKYVLAPPNPQPGDSIGEAQRQIDAGFRYQSVPSLVQQAFVDVATRNVMDEKKNYESLIYSVKSTEKFQLAGIPFEIRMNGKQAEVTIKAADAPVYDDGVRVFAELYFKLELKQADRIVGTEESTASYSWSEGEFSGMDKVVVPLKEVHAPSGTYDLWVTVQDRVSMVSESRKISVTY